MRPANALAHCIIWLAVGSAHAGTLIDDSGTLPYNSDVAMRWRETSPRGSADTRMVGTMQLLLRLHVSPWLHRTGHVYLVLPAQQPGPMTVSWTTQGRLLPGQLVSGSRALVYAGLITAPYMEDTVRLTITVDGRRMQQSYPVNFHFEMDED